MFGAGRMTGRDIFAGNHPHYSFVERFLRRRKDNEVNQRRQREKRKKDARRCMQRKKEKKKRFFNGDNHDVYTT